MGIRLKYESWNMRRAETMPHGHGRFHSYNIQHFNKFLLHSVTVQVVRHFPCSHTHNVKLFT